MKLRILIILFLFISIGVNTDAQEKQEITVNWIYSNASGEVTAIPRFVWLKDNTALVYDTRKPMEERSIEKFDPRTGKSIPAVDLKKALASLKALLGANKSPGYVNWSRSFDNEGKKGIYIFNDDIFLLDLAKSKFNRVTTTAEVERGVHFSPDGKMVSFVRENDLYVYDIDKKVEKRLTTDGSDTILNGTLSWIYWEEIFGRNDTGYWWSDDSKSIAYLKTDESTVSITHFVDFKPAVPRVIKQRYPKAGMANPIVRVGIADIKSSKTKFVDFGDAEYEYITRVEWLPDNKRLSVQTLNRGQTELDLFFIDRGTGKATFIMKEEDEAWVNLQDDLTFLKDGDHFIWHSERDGYAHLYLFSMTGDLVNQITQGEWAVCSSGGAPRQSIAAIDEKSGWIYFSALKKASVERQLYRIKFDGSGLELLTKGDGTHRISFSPDENYYLDSFSNIHSPPSLSLFNSEGKLIKKLAEPRIDMADVFDFQYPELFTIPASDGFPMPAEILKPKDFNPNKKYPVIMNVYGGPSAPTVSNSWNRARYFDQILLREGYLVVRFDHRVATGISKNLENLILKKFIGPVELADIIDGVRWLKLQPYTDGDRFGIWGWSGGGSFTLYSMTSTKEFKAGISVAPVTDWHYYDTKWTEFAMKRPQDNPEGYKMTSIVRNAKNLHGRLLLVHGTYDDNVHPQNAWHFIEELIQNNIPFDMMFYPMRKHGISDRPARIHLYNKMLEFWREHL